MNAKLLFTKNLAMFTNDMANRDVESIKKLQKSMQKYWFIPSSPLHVVKRDGKLFVKDGGHRLESAKSLKIGVFYVVCEDIDISIPEINNTQTRWKIKDYVASHYRSGNKQYMVLSDFHAQHKSVPITICPRLPPCAQARG